MYKHPVESEKYEGKYIALKSFEDKMVVAYGNKPQKVMQAALDTGAKRPVIVYVPKHDRICIY